MLTRTFAVAALTASLTAVGASPGLAGAQHTPRFPGWYDMNASAAQSRANLSETVLTPTAVAKVKLLRNILTPPTVRGAFCRVERIVSPLPAGNSLYAVTSGKLSKYDPATGKLLWRHTPPTGSGYESLAISGNTIVATAYTCGSASEPPSFITAYNATTGKILWQATSGLEGLTQSAVAGPYVIAVGQDAAGYFINVLNLSNGKPAWHRDGCFTSAPVIPLVVAQMALWYSCDGQGNPTMVASNLATGKQAWTLPSRWTFQSSDLSGSAGKHLYARDPAGTIDDLNPLTGTVGYSLSGAVKVLAVDLSRVYATCGSDGQSVCAYDISTGAMEWQDTNLGSTPIIAAEADGVLYLGTGVALNAATGQVIKTLWVPAPKARTIAIAVGNGRIAVVTNPRILHLYGLKGS